MKVVAFLACYLLAINVTSFVIYGLDKLKAKRGRWRIKESVLLFLCAVGGSAGSWLGMLLWRHKTRHLKFRVWVPLFFFLHVGLLLLAWCEKDAVSCWLEDLLREFTKSQMVFWFQNNLLGR